MQKITHAGQYKLAYDRINGKYGRLESEPEKRVFYGSAQLQKALDDWAMLLEENLPPIRYILTGGLYVDKPGAHKKGIAIDVDGFIFSNNRYLALSAPLDWKMYLKIEATLRFVFGQVLNYDYNIAHRDHWHCDLTLENINWIQSRSQILFAQGAINVIFQEPLKVDGVLGPKTLGAITKAGYYFPNDWKRFLFSILNTSRSIGSICVD